MRNIGIIIGREYRERVRKKSFIITTILMPLLMVGLYLAPTLIMRKGGTSLQHIIVIDDSPNSVVSSQLVSDSEVEFKTLNSGKIDDILVQNSDKRLCYGILHIGSEVLSNPSQVTLYLNTSASMLIEEKITNQLEEILTNEKINSFNIEGLKSIIESSTVSINRLHTIKNGGDSTGGEKNPSSIFSYLLALFLGLILYMILIIYGQTVQSSVIEEKSSRVLDVIVTTCKPFDIMMGKIIGVAAVAATQIGIWALLLISCSQLAIPALAMVGSTANIGGAIDGILGQLGNIGFIIKLMTCMFFYVIGGFLLYASLFAAVGSTAESAQDCQQFTTIIMLPIIFSLIIMMQVFNNPNSPILVWCSMIPFTSPIVMMARLPYDVATWEILVSLAILFITFIFTTWGASRIYRIGILTHGKRPSWRDLIAWIKE